MLKIFVSFQQGLKTPLMYKFNHCRIEFESNLLWRIAKQILLTIIPWFANILKSVLVFPELDQWNLTLTLSRETVCEQSANLRGVVRTFSNIHNRTFLQKYLTARSCSLYSKAILKRWILQNRCVYYGYQVVIAISL